MYAAGHAANDTAPRGVANFSSMLIDIASGKRITKVPFRPTFDTVRLRLSDVEFQGIIDRINELIDSGDKQIATAGWLPGSDWSATPFWPIYEKAAQGNQDLAARMFGLMVWFTVMERDEAWASGRFEKGGREIGSR